MDSTYPPISRRGARLWAHASGAVLGGTLSLLAMTIASLFGFPATDVIPIGLTMLAVGVGSVIGGLRGASVVATDRPIESGIVLAVQAVVVTVGLVVGILGVGAQLSEQPGFVAPQMVLVLPFALVLGLVMGLPVTAPVSLILTATMRVAARRRVPGTVLIAAVAVAAVLASPAVAGLRFASAGQHAGWGPIQLDWTVENRSCESLTLGVWDPEPDGSGGWTSVVAPCLITAGSTDAATDWFLSLDHGTDDEAWIADPSRLVSAVDAPGAHAEVWIEIAPDGTMTAYPGRAHPAPEALTADLCATTGVR